jgi:hypothetical protein
MTAAKGQEAGLRDEPREKTWQREPAAHLKQRPGREKRIGESPGNNEGPAETGRGKIEDPAYGKQDDG